MCPYWLFFLTYWALKLKVLDQKCSRRRGSGFLRGIWPALYEALVAKVETGAGCRACGGRMSRWQCFITCHPGNQASHILCCLSELLLMGLSPLYLMPCPPSDPWLHYLFTVLHLLFPGDLHLKI